VAITHVVSQQGNNATAVNQVIVMDAGIAANDILLLWVTQGRTVDPPDSVTDDDTGGNAWALVVGNNQFVVSGYLYWKRATSGTAGKTVTVVAASGDVPDSIFAGLSAYRGCETVGVPYENASALGLPSGTESMASITTSRAGSMVCLWNGLSNNVAIGSQAATDPAVLTERYDVGSTAGNDIEIAHASAVRATAGATGTITFAYVDLAAVAAVLNLLEPGASVPRNPVVNFQNPGVL
jgi:hypothetical protein